MGDWPLQLQAGYLDPQYIGLEEYLKNYPICLGSVEKGKTNKKDPIFV